MTGTDGGPGGRAPGNPAVPGLGPLGLLRLPRTILFGPGQRAAIGGVVADIGRTALICTDRRLAGSAELAGVVSALAAA